MATEHERERARREQLRAQDAWDKSAGYTDKARELFAKGLPALIMNSGLMQVLAFCHEKGQKGATTRRWPASAALAARPLSAAALQCRLRSLHAGLMTAAPGDYQAITAEAFAWLRWLRQMAAARNGDNNA
jgi:CRISPR-associated protein Cmr5